LCITLIKATNIVVFIIFGSFIAYNTLSNFCINTNVTYIKTFNLFLCNQHKNIHIKKYLIDYEKEKKDKKKREKMLLKENKKKELKEEKNSIPFCSTITKNDKQCSFKSVKEGLCTRHYKLLNKTSI
jgi:low affinity Fe/Cu permease